MEPLADGDYDVVIVDVEERADDDTRIDVVVTSGDGRGATVSVRASRSARDPVALLGLPAVLRVRDGNPGLSFD